MALAAAGSLAAPAGARLDGPAAAAALDDFGAPAAPAAGVRPLLTVLMHFSDRRFAVTHTRPYYRRLLFATASGRLLGSVAGRGGFFDESSHGRLYYRDAGVYGPFTHPDNPATPIDESTYACASNGAPTCSQVAIDVRSNAIRAADRAGFPFADYDANRDGRVTTEELTILLVFGEPPPPAGARQGGQMRTLPCIPVAGGKQVCTDSIGVGEGVGAATLAHELTHTFNGPFGIDHVYGTRARLNYPYSVFAGTINAGVDDDHRIWHLDPYTKLRLGWLEPRIVPITSTRCLTLRATELPPERGSGATPQAYLLYDPERGTNEYFLLEHRLPLTFNYDGDPFLTGSTIVPDQGLAVWYVRTDATGRLLTVQPWNVAAGGQDPTLYMIPAFGVVGQPNRALGGLWTARDGAVDLVELDLTQTPPRWNPYHVDVGIRVASASTRLAEIQVLLNRTRWCSKPPRRPPNAVPGSMPAPDEGPCRRDRRRDLVCTFRTPSFTLVRRTPQSPVSGRAMTVRWTMTARRDLPAVVHVADRLPKGFRVLRGSRTLTFPALARGKRATRAYRVRPPAEASGRFLETSVVRYRARRGGKLLSRSWRTALPVREPTLPAGGAPAVETLPAPPPAPPDPGPGPGPPPAPELPDLVIASITPNGFVARNGGKAAAGSFSVRVVYTGPNGDLPPVSSGFNGLAAGAEEFRSWPPSGCPAGTTGVRVTADPLDEVDESNEGNNADTGDC